MDKGDAFTVKGAEVKVKEVPNRLQLDNSVSSCVTNIHVYTIRIYMTYCFRECTTTKGSTACFAPLTLSIVRLCIHPFRPLSSQFHEWELLYYDVYHGTDLYDAPCYGFGRKCYYFSQFAKQMLPIVKSPPVPLRCSGFIFLTRLRQSPTLRYFAFVRTAGRIFLHANPCNREIFISVCESKLQEEGKRE